MRYYAANGRVSCQRSRRFVIGIALKCKVKHAAVARIKVSVIVAVYRAAYINIVSSCNIIGKFGTCRADYTALGIGSYNIVKVGAVCCLKGNIGIIRRVVANCGNAAACANVDVVGKGNCIRTFSISTCHNTCGFNGNFFVDICRGVANRFVFGIAR